MDANLYYRQLNILCLNYLLGRLTRQEELALKERLKADKEYRAWFNWLLLKWLKTSWLKKNIIRKGK